MEDGSQVELLTTDQVEELVLTLYQPNHPQTIASTQAALTKLQSSPRAWSVARDLLARSDEKVKFHGALIIIIKLNTESHVLSDSDGAELLVYLIGWYLDSFDQGVSSLVSRKLASALSTFVIHFHRLCPLFVRHMVLCLASEESLQPGATTNGEAQDLSQVIRSLGSPHLRAALWVVSNLMEDASKLDLNSEKNIGLYDVLRRNTRDAVALMSTALSSVTTEALVRQDCVKCLQSWVWFSQKVSSRDQHFTEAFRPLLMSVIATLADETAFEVSIELLTDVVANYTAILTEEHHQLLAELLTSSWSEHLYQRLIGGDSDFEPFQFGQLLLAFAESRVEHLTRVADDRSRGLLQLICGLLGANGIPAVDDKIYVPALEFWSTYVETLTDDIEFAQHGANVSRDEAVSFVLQAVSYGWERICLPPPQELDQWDSSDRVGFSEARKEFADFLQSVFALTGPQVLTKFSELVLSSLSNSAWLQLEGAAFCLGALADCVKEDTRCDEALLSVFSSPLFSTIQARHENMPVRMRQTCVLLVEQYTEFFERNTSLLPHALNLLFSLVGEFSLAAPASKSILRLCSSCRHHLVNEIGAFLDEYNGLMARQKLDCVTTEKILGGIACVAQAIADESLRLSSTERLLALVEADAARSLELVRSPSLAGELSCHAGFRCMEDPEGQISALHTGLRTLRCLAAIGKGFRSPSDAPVELEGNSSRGRQPSPALLDTHRRIFDIIMKLERTFPDSGEVVETICSIVRTGFSESDPGPFVFQPQQVAQFLASHTKQSPRISAIVGTACSLVSSVQQYVEPNDRFQLLSELLLWLIGLLQSLHDPEDDTELTQNAIEFTGRLIVKMPHVLIQLHPPEAAEFFFFYTLRVLDGREPLPKAASAEFWTTFMNTNMETLGMHGGDNGIMHSLGPILAQSLARNIGGNASRSELDKLCEPIKKLVNRFPAAKLWLEAGLNHPSFPSNKVSTQEKAIFVKKLLSLRGSRTSNQVVRDFWLAARGSNFAYAT